jgi:hypothetical protein
MRKILRIALLCAGVAFAGAQFYRPALDLPAHDANKSLKAPPEIDAFLKRSCLDCHSNQPQLPWYAHIAPASWLVAYDIKTGRKVLNLSEWSKLDDDTAANTLGEMCDQTRGKQMPPKKYTLLHPAAVPSEADIKAFCRFAAGL